MDVKKDYYEILGVDQNATQEEIKKNFRRLSIQYHPDKQVGKTDTEKKEAEEKFKEIAEAYAVLSDPKKKQEYDMYGFNSPNANSWNFGNMGMDDIFSRYGDIFSNFGGGFGSNAYNNMWGWGDFPGGQQYVARRRGADLRVKIPLSIKELKYGTTKKIKIKRKVKCSHCNGTGSEDGKIEKCQYCNGTGTETKMERTTFGFTQYTTRCTHCGGTGQTITHKCTKCHGTGLQENDDVIEITIPAGAIEGRCIVVAEKGNYPNNSTNVDIPGNLIVVFTECPDDVFKHKRHDIIYELLLDLPTAVLGGKVEIPLLDGSTKTIDIKAGTQPGTILKQSGGGIPNVDETGKQIGIGDFLIQISVYMPEKLTKEERNIFEKLKKTKNIKK